jgi:nitrite reductase (NADH) large subunit
MRGDVIYSYVYTSTFLKGGYMKHVIVGNGVSGTTAAEEIRRADQEAEITIISEEESPFYSRIRLIEYLAGEADADEIVFHARDWYEKNGINLLLGTRVTSIDKESKEVMTETGEHFAYDRVLIATGGISFIPPISGSDKIGVFALRNIADADRILEYADGKKKIVLIGGGVLGLEAGNSLRKRGYDIQVVEFFPRLLPRQMDPEGAEVLKTQMEGMGFGFYLGAKTKEITGDENADGVLLEDGTRIECDMVVVSAGIRPRAELPKQLELTVNKGVVVDDRMKTDVDGVFAAGDLIEHREMFYGIWPAAMEQGRIAGINMAGGDAVYEGTTMSNVLKVVGIDLAAAGDIDADGKLGSIVHKDTEQYIYRKLVLDNYVIKGCIFYGDIFGYRNIVKAISENRNIGDIKGDLENWDLSGL